MKLITKIRKAPHVTEGRKKSKTDLWLDANMTQEEAKKLVAEMVLTMPGDWKIRSREVEGRNLVDAVFEEYGLFPSMYVDWPLILGLSFLYPKKVYASDTHGLDTIKIK